MLIFPKKKTNQYENPYHNKNKLENQFINAAINFQNKITTQSNELLCSLLDLFLKENFTSFKQILIIKTIWKLDPTLNKVSLLKLEQWLRLILSQERVNYLDEYNLECIIDIWNYGTITPIPIDILEKIILLKPTNGSYGALIKSISYLDGHSEKDIKNVLDKARNSTMYKNDEYYRDWIN